MREIRPSGSEGGVALTPPSLPLSYPQYELVVLEDQFFTLPSLSKLTTTWWNLPPLME